MAAALGHRMADYSYSWAVAIYGGFFTLRLFLASGGRNALDYLRRRLYRGASLRCHASFDFLGICLCDDLCARPHYSAFGDGGLATVPEFVLRASYLLHLSLLLRIGGDIAELPLARRWGGLLNGLAIIVFLANNVRAVVIGQKVDHLKEVVSD